jgi:hypothetical protein
MDGNCNGYFYKGGSLFFAFIFSLTFIIYFSSCSSSQQSYKDKLPDGLKVVSVYGEKNFDKSKMRVDLQGWEADAPQSLFLAEPEKNKTYLMAYVLPYELVREVWGDSATSLSHFVGLDYANIDERTTALWLVMNAPVYFWLFTPRALVYAAKFVVEHPKFEELVKKISETNPGEILSGNYPEIFGLAAKIAEDVREKIFSAEETQRAARLAMMDAEGESTCQCQDARDCPCIEELDKEKLCNVGHQGIAKFEDAPGLAVKFVVRQMVFYGLGIIHGYDPGKVSKIRQFGVLKAQKAKIDLSLSNILNFNFINPKVETVVWLPDGDVHVIRAEKGFEAHWSVFIDPIKRIGLVANLGRTVKYAVEIAVPNIAACIPDGETWGWAVATFQNIFIDMGVDHSFRELINSSWSDILRIIVSQFFKGDSFISKLLAKVGLSGCGSGVDFIIKQIAATFANFPIVKLWNAFTKYIPFAVELFTRPKTGVFYAVYGAPVPPGIPVVRELSPLVATSPGYIKLKTIGPICDKCRLIINCERNGPFLDQSLLPKACPESEYVAIFPPNLGDDICEVLYVYRDYVEKCPPIVGCLGGILTKREWKESVLSRWTVKVEKCDDCSKNYENVIYEAPGGEGGTGGVGGCSTTPPQSPYHIFAILVIFILREVRRSYKCKQSI